MAPSLETDSKQSINGKTLSKTPKSTSILHRTTWQPPVAESAQGIYVTLEDGTDLIDGVGGAAVACVGNGHPKVMQAIKDQVDKVACTRFTSLTPIIADYTIIDVYNMQLSNQPAEALAKKLVDTSGGAFALCGFASGGLILFFELYNPAMFTISFRIGGYGKCFEIGQTGTPYI